ncbi:hypothetical protein [Pseudomonas trivialis]|uniref:Uncharacterized protein n=1 Tax=Pseudomonas trivialis TaxID=200450 RepID=A0A0R2ZC45_9PSED|nr:hypothetical protein [Pseudomonas trivialis]KRP58720.1 hypothetical protein TU79_18330 [Pseudomonas trivialis]SDS93702.1 hypothetical protein SAMN04490205_4152 [Pseudomonas trivialis]
MTDNLVKLAVQAQFCMRPTLRAVVAQMLADTLREKYPPLTHPIAQLRLALPRSGGGRDLKPLVDAALEYIAARSLPDLTRHGGLDVYLSDASGTRLTFEADGTHSYDLDVVEAVIRELPLWVSVAFQDALVAYWNAPSDAGGSRWQWFAGLLQGQLRAEAIRQLGGDGQALQCVTRLADYPARETRSRRSGPERSLHAYSVETRLVQGQTRVTRQSSDILLVDDKQVWLCSLSGRIEAYSSLDAFGEAWGQRMAQQFIADSITWQLYEPDGNIFEVQAALVLNAQLDDLAAVDLTTATTPDHLHTLFESITDPAAQLNPAPAVPRQTLLRIEAALPDWLEQASPDLRFAYRRCLLEQASARRLDDGKTWLDGLDDIRTYACRHLDNQMCLARNAWLTGERTCDTDDPKYHADKLELTFAVPVGTLSGGYIEPVHMNLVDLALKNLSGSPKGSMTLRDSDGQAIEAWLTPDYVKQLVQRVDIGLNYPNYMREQLLADSADARQRKRLFIAQRPLRLKSQALEHAIRREAGLTATGADYVAAVVASSHAERYVDNVEIVMRPLAFQRKPGALADVVHHMFIIEPLNGQVGPHLLYRPAYRQSLLQFTRRAQLLAAIAEPGDLQDSVLAWLDDRARPIYSNGGFNEPHYVRIGGIGSEFDPLPAVPKPATLAGPDDQCNDELAQSLSNGQLMEYLFTSEVRQLLAQADRESNSNAESRWALILEGAQLGFDTLLMLARGPAAVVGWFVQLVQSLAQDLPALVSDDPTARELAQIDLLLNTAMVLVHQATASPVPDPPLMDHLALARLPLRRTPGPAITAPPTIRRGAVGLPAEPPGGGRTLLDFDHSLAGDSASARMLQKLLAFKVAWPDPLPAPVEIGAFKGLYNIDGAWHATIGGLFLRVNIVAGFGEVFIVPPDKPTHPGIKLATDGKGHWTLDRGLKLLGGGPKRLAALRETNRNALQDLSVRMHSLQEQNTLAQREVNASFERMSAARSDMARQSEKLGLVWKLLNSVDTTQRPALQARLQLEIEGYSRLRTQFLILLETLQERVDALQPMQLEWVQVGDGLQKLAAARALLQDVTTALRSIWLKQYGILMFHRYRLGTLSSTPRGEPLSDLIERMYREKRQGDPTAYNEFVAMAIELADIKQAMAKVAGAMETTLDQLERFSVDRRRARESLLAEVNHPQHLSPENLKLEAMITLSWIAIEPPDPGHFSSPQEELYMTQLASAEIPQAVQSHIEVRSSADYPLEDQRRVYETVLAVYNRYKNSLNVFKTISPDRLHPSSERFEQELRTARELAENDLEAVVCRHEAMECQHPPAENLRPKTATKRVFKTNKQRYFIGDLKPAQSTTGTSSIVITDTLTGAAIATYDEQAGGWVHSGEKPAANPEPAPAARSLATLKSQGQALIRQREGIERVVNSQRDKLQSPLTRQDVNPADWDELLSGQAAKLNDIADEVAREHATHAAAQDLIDDLRANARDMNRLAQSVTSAGYKQQWPSLQGIEYLWRHKEIDINLVSPADPQRPTLRGDFFTEYAVYDKTRKPPVVLWYAHFHYATADAAPAAYTRAHLKLPEQRKFTQRDLLKQHVQIHLHAQQGAGAEPLGKILYVLIRPPQDQLFLAIAPPISG